MDMIDLIKSYSEFIKTTGSPLESLAGISVGTTPSGVAYSENKMRLLHYYPATEKQHPVPVFIVYALVNRYYIMDLQPDKSVVKRLLDEGFDTYIVDWGYPSGDDRHITLDRYVNGYLNNAVDKIMELSGSDKVTLLGVCQGGDFSIMYAALHPEKVKNLITLNTPVDFDTDKSLLNIWSKNMDVDRIVDHYGVVPGELLNMGYSFVDPLRHLIDVYSGVYNRTDCIPDDINCLDEESIRTLFRIIKWGLDNPGQAGEAYRQFIKDLYQRNLLIRNELELDGKKIDIRNITVPLLNIMARYDNFIPNESSIPLNDAVSSRDKTMLIFPTGHIGVFVSSISQRDICPTIVGWLKPRSSSAE